MRTPLCTVSTKTDRKAAKFQPFAILDPPLRQWDRTRMTATNLRPRSSRWICAAALLALSPALMAAGQTGYYRWTDDKGATQFTQQPPAGRPSEFVRTATGTSSKVEAGAAETGSTTTGTEPQATGEKPASGGLEGVPDKDPAKCEQTRNTQGILNSSARIREKGPDGEYRYLNPDEIAEQKRLAEEAIKIYCN